MVIEKLVVAYRSRPVLEALRRAFAPVPEVMVTDKDILRCGCDAIVSPGNSFGDMGGGLDKHLDDYSKGKAQELVRDQILRDFFGELPVGHGIVVKLGLRRLRYLVVAPTMRIPGNVAGSLNAYLAFRAALLAVMSFNKSALEPIRSLAVSGLCTGVGGMDPQESALQMAVAYDNVVGGGWARVAGQPALAPFSDR